MKAIELSRGMKALVDDEDYERINSKNWHVAPKRRNFYAVRVVTENSRYKERVQMSHEVLNLTDKSLIVDHKDNNTLNNQKSNLRVCTAQQNNMNKKAYIVNKSGYKGVLKGWKGVWLAQIIYNKKKYHLGTFKTSEEAAVAYNKKATEFFGEFANLNIVNPKPKEK